ncbi:hypothetical protein crov236 [Cafeteria roenbergensis virus]|uniref:Uncharacterized protein n=1 Tax=Cafeteria roenbergensis virus (strain BV-PW1) TaxID=693272 RepID=E3T506_CROVB|nr:hypothetical protein crov236 [Cafeteria roenbergensis virus BV-PW1]ADO67269.1 hypothetical protein crov236 [Cafeteria roenbergensis virus BV-PW1]
MFNESCDISNILLIMSIILIAISLVIDIIQLCCLGCCTQNTNHTQQINTIPLEVATRPYVPADQIELSNTRTIMSSTPSPPTTVSEQLTSSIETEPNPSVPEENTT